MEDLARRYGFDVNAHHVQLFGEAGLPFTRHERIPNSHAALNVAELARERGIHEQVHSRLMTAYWAEDRDISDPAVLADVSGLDTAEVVEVATSRTYEDRIRASTVAVHEMGAGGVPAFVIDDKLLIPGAQPHSLFEKVMEKLGHGSVASTDDAPTTQA